MEKAEATVQDDDFRAMLERIKAAAMALVAEIAKEDADGC